MPQLKYPIGTRYIDSEIYDEATDEVAHGWQVFRQCTPDGKPTGRKSFVNQHGNLCGLSIAEQCRKDAVVSSAHEAIELLAKAQLLGLRFDIGNAYIRRAFIDEQDALNKKIDKLLSSAIGIR
jgi:hypothetical protein